MKTAYLKSLTTTLCPFSSHAKTPRLVLGLLPPAARSRIAVKTNLLSRSTGASAPATLDMVFSDGAEMRWVWKPRGRGGSTAEPEKKKEEEANVKDVVEQVERHYRGLARKQELSG